MGVAGDRVGSPPWALRRAAGGRPWRTIVAIVLLLAAGACQRGATQRPHVIVVLIDTLRADRLGCYGNPDGLTPFLDELAARGTVFTHAYAPSSWTLPSVASLFTSRYPSQHHVHRFESKLAAGEVTLAERLAEAGYLGAGFVANFQLDEKLGYAQGFSDWRIFRHRDGMPAGDMLPSILFWVDQAWPGSPNRARLLYLHYLEPHSPYDPREPYRTRFRPSWVSESDAQRFNAKLKQFDFSAMSPREMEGLVPLYDGEVASIDDALRRTFAELEARKVLDNAIVVITSDHGEEFLEHGRFAHGYALYEESVRVPLIFVGPGIAAGRRVEQNVSLVDVAPTLLDLLDLAAQPTFEGRSLRPQMERSWLATLRGRGGAEERQRNVLIELPPTGSPLDQRAQSVAWLAGPLKLAIALEGAKRSEVPELFDLASDPGEKHPNPPGREEEAESLRSSLRTELTALAARARSEGEKGSIDEATREALRALGYAP
jgi:arylsulfatase A-like enzyme